MKSLMHLKDGTCYLCMKFDEDYSKKPCDEHHAVYGWANRRLSEKYGLKVYLCREKHHEYGPMSVHQNRAVRKIICADAQRTFEECYPWLNFRSIFGKNWIDEMAIQ